jgi:glycogen debranching enzyme
VTHLDDYGVGTLAEIFDAEPPYTPRGCIAQAWSVAELLRAWARTAPAGPTAHPRRENAAGLEAPPRFPPPDEPAD